MKNLKLKTFIGYIFLIISLSFLGYKYVNNRKSVIEEHNRIKYTLANQIGYKISNKKVELYDAILVIPKINLEKGIYKKNDSRNNIDENVTIHEYSDYPDNDNSNVILMAHSGNGNKAYFNDLDKLDSDSLVEFYYNHIKYTYKIDYFYEIDKTGFACLKKNANKKIITLITCSQKDKSKQLVYVGYLIDETFY